MLICKHNEKELHKEDKLKIFVVFPIVFLVLGIIYSYYEYGVDSSLKYGLKNIILSPTILITDFFEVGGVGATFINVSFLTYT